MADKIKEAIKQNTAILDPYASMVPVFVDLSAKAGMNPGSILGAIGAVFLLILLILQGWTIMMTSITVLYPALLSIRAIESADEEDDKVWLTYWMVFGLFNVAETFFGFIFWFIPYWGWIRVGLFIWLLLPQFNGSKVIYESALRPLLVSNKDLVKHYTEKFTSGVSDIQNQAAKQATSAVTDAMKDPSVLAAGASALNKAQEFAKTDDVEPVKVAENVDE